VKNKRFDVRKKGAKVFQSTKRVGNVRATRTTWGSCIEGTIVKCVCPSESGARRLKNHRFFSVGSLKSRGSALGKGEGKEGCRLGEMRVAIWEGITP